MNHVTQRRKQPRLMLLLSALIPLYVGCAGSQGHTRLLSVELERVDGGFWDLRDEAGQVVVLQFLASFDAASIAMATTLEQFHIRYRGQGVSVIGVAMDPPDSHRRNEIVENFCALNNLTFDVVLANEELGSGETLLGRIPSIPATVVFDRRGNPVASTTGLVNREELEGLLDALINGGAHPLLTPIR